MKKFARILVLLLVLTIAIMCFVACGGDENPQELDFFPLDGGTYGVKCGSAGYLSDIVVPSTYKGKAVTKILDEAFTDCSSLRSITIPDNVTSIGNKAFYDCASFQKITIPDSVISMGINPFFGCTALTIYCEAESKPDGWSSQWNSSNCPVVWNCNNNDVADDGYMYTISADLN